MAGDKVPQDKIEQIKPIAILGGIMIAIALVAVACACGAKFLKHKFCLIFEIPILFIISIVLLVFGGLLTVPANGGPRCPRHNLIKNHGYTVHRDPTGRWHTYQPDGTEIN